MGRTQALVKEITLGQEWFAGGLAHLLEQKADLNDGQTQHKRKVGLAQEQALADVASHIPKCARPGAATTFPAFWAGVGLGGHPERIFGQEYGPGDGDDGLCAGILTRKGLGSAGLGARKDHPAKRKDESGVDRTAHQVLDVGGQDGILVCSFQEAIPVSFSSLQCFGKGAFTAAYIGLAAHCTPFLLRQGEYRPGADD